MSEYERLGGRLPLELETIVKEYSMPRYMKPMPEVIRQIDWLNRDGGVGNRKCHTCYLVLMRAVLVGGYSAKKKREDEVKWENEFGVNIMYNVKSTYTPVPEGWKKKW